MGEAQRDGERLTQIRLTSVDPVDQKILEDLIGVSGTPVKRVSTASDVLVELENKIYKVNGSWPLVTLAKDAVTITPDAEGRFEFNQTPYQLVRDEKTGAILVSKVSRTYAVVNP